MSLVLISQKLNKLGEDEKFYESVEVKSDIALRWFPIVTLIRDDKIEKQAAIDSMYKFTNEVWEFLEANIQRNKIKKYSVDEWVFPVKGYTPAAIGGRNGSGYVPGNFDFFVQSSYGHPAHDIFINDRDQDCLDDATNEPVEILSMSGGIVVETRKDWTTDRMDIKGGNIVYVYDNYTNGLFYYAHLKEVYVNVGDFVKPGTELGIMGRTGANAYPSRSPTHLHIMYVRSVDGDLIPEDIYGDLLNARLTD
ncbi:MAG: M23 family metallopeptidase [Ignavibacteriae bacterium]|nr:M23 family metallopeptidase [Ignavibacteriota bacterium]